MPKAAQTDEVILRTHARIADVDAAAWDACANPNPAAYNPFVAHAFLKACEESKSATPRAGWRPMHATLEERGRVIAAAPLYLKSHSYGEYVFDQAWADAWERAGGNYYPKLLCAAPFTPVPGPRLLVLGDMGEVGEQGPAFHAEVGAYARQRGVEHLLAHGPQAIHAAMAFGGGRHFDDIGALIDAVRTHLPQCATLAVKGSRFMRMERVVAQLLAPEGSTCS